MPKRFYHLNRNERLQDLVQRGILDPEDVKALMTSQLSDLCLNGLTENSIGSWALPLSVALNFCIDNESRIIPMVNEEPSVIAAADFGAKLIQKSGGFTTTMTDRLSIGQIILCDIIDLDSAKKKIEANREELTRLAEIAHPSLKKYGGGLRDITVFPIVSENNERFLRVHLYLETGEAMGANITNTILEKVAPALEQMTSGSALLRILSNYTTQSCVSVSARIKVEDLSRPGISGIDVANRIVKATQYANLDVYRAVTHNKGIMNGVSAVALAFGNDYRALDAAIHAYAAREGSYKSLSTWELNDTGYLLGQLTIPLHMALVGGATTVLPLVNISKRILRPKDAKDLARVTACVGLSQNLAALRALVSEGIQKGHMYLQTKSLAITAGAQTEAAVQWVMQGLADNPIKNLEEAKKCLKQYQERAHTHE